jgi:hypothetical protein
MERFGKVFKTLFASGLICAALMVSPVTAQEPCKGPLERDDTLGATRCCSGVAIPGSTECDDPDDYGDDWETCSHICAPQA